jgi:hypothetical protein
MIGSKLIRAVLTGLLGAAIVFAFSPPGYGQGKRYGVTEGSYGERRPVKTAKEAEKILKGIFKGRDVRIGEIKERELFFEAEIRDGNGRLIDRVIIDKRTGRARSIF